jgi:hypothetical protein
MNILINFLRISVFKYGKQGEGMELQLHQTQIDVNIICAYATCYHTTLIKIIIIICILPLQITKILAAGQGKDFFFIWTVRL